MAQQCKYCHSAVVTSLMTCPYCHNPLEIEYVDDEDVQLPEPPEKPVSVPYGASNRLQAAGYLPGTMSPPASSNGAPPPKETPLPPPAIIPPSNIPDPTFAPQPSTVFPTTLPPPAPTLPPRPRRSRGSLVALIIFLVIDIVLLAVSGGVTLYGVNTANSASATTVAVTQAQSTSFAGASATAAHNAQVAATSVQATATQQSGNDSYQYLGQGVLERINLRQVSPGQQFTIYFALQNNGTATWSDARGYQLDCKSEADNPGCLEATSPIGLNGNLVPRGQGIVFIIPVTAPQSAGDYRSIWRFYHNGTLLGSVGLQELFIPFTVV